jgi:hypothetical protein
MLEQPIKNDHEAEPTRFPRLLTGVGLFAGATFACEIVVRHWPAPTTPLFGSLAVFGMIWLAVIALRTCERSADPQSLSRLDQILIYWSGPLSVLLILAVPVIALANIDERDGRNYFTSDWVFQLVELLMSSGFVLSLCCLASRRGRHLPPRRLWKLICAPLLLLFGAYALLMPLSCTAAKMGID